MQMRQCDECGYLDVRKAGTECPQCDDGEMVHPDPGPDLPDFEEYESDEPNRSYDPEYCSQALAEMLGDVDAFTASDGGPNGPWYYKSLTVRRDVNTLRVIDVDGVLAELIQVGDLPDGDDAAPALVCRLESINSETMAAL